MTKALRVVFFAALVVPGFVAPQQLAYAQEFNCTAGIDFSLLTGNEYSFLNQLGERVEEYVNDRAWTEDTFEEKERIECQIQITVEEAISLTSFQARLVLAMRRPIYGTVQNTTVIQFNDSDWQFNYAQGSPLIFDLERYNPLTSVLDFYVHIMLGYDYDTFSDMGGTPYFERARRIAERAQAQNAPGWSQLGTEQGRQNLVTQLLDARYQKLRKAYFDYHFGGLDHFVTETETAREIVLGVLESLEQLREEVARSYVQDLFFSTKYQELTAIFTESPLRNEAFQVLSQVDPAHMTEYNKLMQ